MKTWKGVDDRSTRRCLAFWWNRRVVVLSLLIERKPER